jgi:hypothetical protein
MAENELEPTDPPVIGDEITVSGKVVIAKNVAGEASNFGLRGVVVYAVDGEGNVVAQTVSAAEGDKAVWGDFTLTVPAGTTQLYVGDPTKSADSIANRGFTIAGGANVEGAVVPVFMCDYNDDGYINAIDKASFNDALKGDYNIYADFNNDGYVNAIDKASFNDCLKAFGRGVSYTDALSF